MPSLSEKLKSLGVKVGASGLKPPAQPVPDASAPGAALPVESVVAGCYRPGRRGETFVAGRDFAADYRHGNAPLALSASLETISAWAGDPRLGALPLTELAFLDTESSGLAGGTGTYAFMVGVGRFLSSGLESNGQMIFRVEQVFMRDPSEEPALLEALAGCLAPARALVTFNGKAFDAPLLATRYAMHAIPCPFAGFAHLDILPLARRLWRDRLPSRALKYLEENVLMAPRTAEEVPGYEIPSLYFDYLRSRNAGPLKGVFYHNAIDIVALAALTAHVAAILEDPFAGRVEHGLDFLALAKLFEKLGRRDLAARLYERGLESRLPEADFSDAVRRLSRLQHRRGDLGTAVRLWEQAAACGHVYAHVELAKYYEHHARDAASALAWTRAAIVLLDRLNLSRDARDRWRDELEHRRRRLEGKSAGA